jgi:hypothetical protein
MQLDNNANCIFMATINTLCIVDRPTPTTIKTRISNGQWPRCDVTKCAVPVGDVRCLCGDQGHTK